MTIEYVVPTDVRESPAKRQANGNPIGMDAYGYGSRIATDRQLLVDGKWYRVYATCWSNAASHWIKKSGKKLFWDGH